MVPVIAIPCRRLQHGDGPGGEAQGALLSYLTALSSVGAAAVLIPVQSVESASMVLARADGLMIVGGEDVAAFAEDTSGGGRVVDPGRDEVEFGLVRAALQNRIPVLGICRGLQVMNVALGGTVAPIRAVASNPTRHVANWRSGECYVHEVALEEGSLLTSICGRTGLHVNGAHAFCVDRIGRGLRVAATAPDGAIEALESDVGGDCVGVQWHPESLATAGDDCARRLFEWLVRRAVACTEGRP